jgi:hypothetical protein
MNGALILIWGIIMVIMTAISGISICRGAEHDER